MSTNRERVAEILGTNPQGLCDDCLSDLAGVKPRQSVFQICRDLAKESEIARVKAVCPKDCSPRTKWVSRPVTRIPNPPGSPSLEAQTTRLADYLFRMTEMLRKLDLGAAAPKELFFAKLARLKEHQDRIRNISPSMLTVNGFRNKVSKERQTLDGFEWAAVEGAWSAIDHWWRQQPESKS
jgi:hypothetical protein